MRDERKYRFVFASMWFGGTTTAFKNLRDEVSNKCAIDASWVQLTPEPDELIARIPPISMNWTLKGGLVARSRIRAIEKAGSFDAAYFNDHLTAAFHHVHVFGKRVPSVVSLDVTPLLMDKYGRWYNVPSSRGKNPIEVLKYLHTRKTYNEASFLMPWTSWVKDSLIEDYGVDEERIRVNPPGINLQLWRCDGLQRAQEGARPRILFVGFGFERKGGNLLSSLARNEAFSNCDFHFVTDGCAGPSHPNIVVHKDLKPNSKELIDVYANADIFVLPTYADFFPLAMLEAMAMRLPVIATNVGGISEMLTNRESGFLIDPGDETALKDRLMRLVANREMRIIMGGKARSIAETKYDLSRNTEVVLEVLKQAALSKNGHSSWTN